MNAKTWLVLGASLGMLAVAAGTFGAHALSPYHEYIDSPGPVIAKAKEWWETANHYHMLHALALLAVGLIVDRRPTLCANLAGLAMFLGTLVFSGLLYAMALSNIRILGAIVPIGGVLFIVGWVLLAIAASGFSPPQPSGAGVPADKPAPALSASAESEVEGEG